MSKTLSVFKEKFMNQLKLEGLEVKEKVKKSKTVKFKELRAKRRESFRYKPKSMIQEMKNDLIIDSDDVRDRLGDSSGEDRAIIISSN